MVDIVQPLNDIPHENKKELKTKDYVLRAMKKYRNKKYAEDEDYRNKERNRVKDCREKNKEKYNEYHREYMKKYNARKKLEKQELQKQSNKPINTISNDDSIIDNIEKITINNNESITE